MSKFHIYLVCGDGGQHYVGQATSADRALSHVYSSRSTATATTSSKIHPFNRTGTAKRQRQRYVRTMPAVRRQGTRQ